MAKMILIGEVAHLAKDIETEKNMLSGAFLQDYEKAVQFRDMIINENVTSTNQSPKPDGHRKRYSGASTITPHDNLSSDGSSTAHNVKPTFLQQSTTAKVKLLNLLDEWYVIDNSSFRTIIFKANISIDAQ